MKFIILAILLAIAQLSFSQTRRQFLKHNQFDLLSTEFSFPQNDFKIIGFGAYHGSQKTEVAEHILLADLLKNKLINYYLPETDFAIAHYFNQYLHYGDTVLLKDLVKHYGQRVPQEQSIETFNKWKDIKALNDNQPDGNKLEVVGIDLIVTYKYTAKLLIELLPLKKGRSSGYDELVQMVTIDTTDYSPDHESFSKAVLKKFVTDYQEHLQEYQSVSKNTKIVTHLINNINLTFKKSGRERTLFENYIALSEFYNFKSKPQFVRMGFFHIEKDRENNNPSFFTRLIENKIYDRNQVISIAGFLTKSRVLWDVQHNHKNEYLGYTTKGGFGIGDYWKEYFKGIGRLKRTRLSDLTLYHLNLEHSPYREKRTDLMEIKTFPKKSNKDGLKGKTTTDYFDYALLISNSAANSPLELKQ